MKRLVLLLFVLALFAPRAAWAVHVSDHEPIATETAAHMHDAGNAHHVDSTDTAVSMDDYDDQGESGGFIHHHPPSALLSFVALPLAGAELPPPSAASEPVRAAVPDGMRLASPELPHRPPRAA